ncbi:hypothetical protein BT96DRAFT_1010942 [Gymnopus androsaceus JB14]|uniref:Uncharacterized protein n=1 Tax=Gymnopus androsaceus JB14 TaxID=1447944 RepID=A0A6A4G9Z7_9AGAR|nr:hypothetical protein BT96DRAFT_1010942 [Gymnopus androsaceus JB14]
MIHSDIAFKQLRLSDIASSTVNYSLPAKYFRRRNFEELRAAFTLLPTSLSSLDNVKAFSSWIHEDSMTTKRAWPFPLGSPFKGNKALLDESTELLSFVMPMIRRLEAPNPCFNSSIDLGRASPFTQNPYIVSRYDVYAFLFVLPIS